MNVLCCDEATEIIETFEVLETWESIHNLDT
jgi:hypothetical protein